MSAVVVVIVLEGAAIVVLAFVIGVLLFVVRGVRLVLRATWTALEREGRQEEMLRKLDHLERQFVHRELAKLQKERER